MGKERLEQNLIDQMKEAQLKLGFEEETMRLYYPVASLNLLLGTNCETAKEMVTELTALFADRKSVLGAMSFRVSAGRIDLFSNPHDKSVGDVKAVFEKFGAYVCEEMPEGSDFDEALHFEDPSVDEYYYCVKEEMGHLIYHRFLKEDYQKLL